MKKLILSAMLLGGAAMAANAQAGSVLVFGQIGYSSEKNAADDKTRTFNVNPGVGYQFDNHWTLGVTGSFATSRSKAASSSEWGYTNTYGAGAFLRYTMPVGRIFAFYSQLEAGYIGQTWGTTNTNGSTSANGFGASLTPAVAILISDGFALNFGYGGISYTTMKTSGVSGSNNNFDITFGNQFNIGISKNIFCNKGRHKHHGVKMNHGSSGVDKDEMKDDDN